jgi:hypothetical protein
MKKPIKITSLDAIKALSLSTGRGVECFISLAGGLVRSSKNIYWNGRRFEVLNEIDGTFQKLTEKHILDERYTNIGKAMRAGALYQHQF